LGVASGAIAGHLIATALAILGGAFLANYLSEKLVRQKKKVLWSWMIFCVTVGNLSTFM
jgi:putative Ca2+/H+ antiporter (TMEM165/GDT1 family)